MGPKYKWLLLVTIFGIVTYQYLKPVSTIKPSLQRVVYVYDGDTIKLSSGEKIRYIGIDSPELSHKGSTEECFAQNASEFNRKLVLNKEIRMVKDVSDKDRYGRLLRYVYVKNEQGDELFVNETLVKEGYAFMTTYLPDIAQVPVFQRAQKFARDNKKGMWKDCIFDRLKRRRREYE